MSQHAAPALSHFRYFSQREPYLWWLEDPGCQPLRRPVEAPVAAALQRGESPNFYCHAHQGEGQLVHAPGAVTATGYYWRESGACSVCAAITRIRLAAEWFHRSAADTIQTQIYLTEQLTPLYKALRNAFPKLVGSEFTPSETARVAATAILASYVEDPSAEIRHEDVCHLTFADESFDLIGSFDVLEHVPDYKQALSEFRRVLRDGGQLLLTAPFLNASPATLVRARIENGDVIHVETAEYHGNPTIPGDGVLCFYHFGWDLLDALRSAGFSSVAMLDAWGEATALFGDQNAIVATR
jgi:SAM-dependent methyltransferase